MPSWCMPTCCSCSAAVLPVPMTSGLPGTKAGPLGRSGVPHGMNGTAVYPAGTTISSSVLSGMAVKPSRPPPDGTGLPGLPFGAA